MYNPSSMRKPSVRVLLGVRLLAIDTRTEGHAGEAAVGLKDGVPVGKSPVVGMRDSHMSYVVIW